MIYKTDTRVGVQKPQGAGNGPRLTRSLDKLYHKKHVIIWFADGTSIEGVVTRFTMFWLEVRLNNGKVVYVNKGSIKLIEPVEEGGKEELMGGGENGRSKSK
jgi:sRNA-binding regulator protein Hfq